MVETIRRPESTSMKITTSRSATSEWSPVCIDDNSLHGRFITEVWSENIFQWISSKEKQFGKIGRDRNTLVL